MICESNKKLHMVYGDRGITNGKVRYVATY
jgi:hypothetical protein